MDGVEKGASIPVLQQAYYEDRNDQISNVYMKEEKREHLTHS